LQLLLGWTSLRDSQRAEYLADETAARAGGTDAAVGLMHHLVMTTSIDTVVCREARAGNGMSAWRDAARVARASSAVTLPVLRRLTRHTEVSLYASHPPTGLRAAMLERWPRQTATVTLTDGDAARIVDELAVHQQRFDVSSHHLAGRGSPGASRVRRKPVRRRHHQHPFRQPGRRRQDDPGTTTLGLSGTRGSRLRGSRLP
jgi:hypothetical protein